ncbi:predicted phage baseplate assembly protein [Jatrophihabitans sp. GAS493]|uniref:putative baseplate assembly protein n=1 Tax=Jatrophihabitans sp. GAS493 TaxID=1907575 RepID=UPI000BB690C7|nr:putative baseplate assembly protein [Jatrophihabitans sp. GAS493]SOD70950.1 predicted phage baseplate assembly protein [Jatrophihabitans sp. GAS493]
MPLPAPNLDDRRFQDIVDEAKRLIPRYCPEWTNHNVSDPGVALIELFAWMSEMVLFRVNQVPERLYVHFLNLVGVEPFPPSVSRVDLTFWLTAVLDTAVVVPANSEVTTAGSVGTEEPVVFTTAQELVIAPPELQYAKTVTMGDERVSDVWDDLRFDPLGVRCFASPTLTPGDGFYLGFARSLAGTMIRLRLEAEADGIGVDPRNPPLLWEIWNGEAWITALVHEDGTGGLNRAGDIVLIVPSEHELLTVGNTPAYWLRARLLSPRPGQPTYQASPRVRSVLAATLGGTVAAEHAEVVGSEVIGRSDGSPAQVFRVARTPVLPRRPGEHVQVIDTDGTADWQEVPDFSSSTPRDRHYVWDSGSGVIRFGPRVRYPDGSVRQHGAVPRDGGRVVVTGYRHGGGARGNVGARTLTVPRSALPYIRGVINLSAASGGVDAESIAEAKIRGPLTLRTGQRAVTAGDFERLTLESSTEVARARCLPASDGNGSVRVLVVPQVRRGGELHQLDDFAIAAPLMRSISEHLDAHRLVGTSIQVATPYYQGVSVVALVHTTPGRPAALVRQRAQDAITRYVDPLTGGPDGTGWPFDADINSAVVTQLLESVDGVERVEEALLFEYDLRTGRRLGSGKDVIRLDQHSLFLSAAHQIVVR